MAGLKKKKSNIQTASIPSPVGGLNARDSIANMPQTDALILDNIFPNTTDVSLRNGNLIWTLIPNMTYPVGATGRIETIMPYNGPTSSRKLFIAVNGGVVADATANTGGSGYATAEITGLANTKFQYVQFSTAGSTYLYGVNGADNPILYNGSTWQQVGNATSPISITGVDPSTFISVNIFKQRLYFIPVNSTSFWYLPSASVGGAALQFDLGPLMRLGGYLMGMVTWTIDEAAGVQEYACFVTSEGEIIVYQGYDPNTSGSWSQVAQFRIGRPQGRRFYTKVGSDIVMLTADGAVQLSESLLADRSQVNIALSDKIRSIITSDIASYAGNFGWDITLYPIGNKLIINVPVIEGSLSYQYVMNVINKSWCTFGKLNNPWLASCFAIWEDNLYFGGESYLAQCDVGQNDNSNDILGTAKQAFSYFGSKGQNKLFTLIRPILIADGQLKAAIDLNVNFENRTPTSLPSFTAPSGSPWDTSPWDTSPWTSGTNVIDDWDTPNAIGFCAAPYLQIQAANLGVSWEATDYAYQLGGVL